MKKPDLWAALLNMKGLYSKEPIQVFWEDYLSEEEELPGFGSWKNIQETLEISTEGLVIRDGVITFADKSKKNVENFIKGVQACQTLLGQWIGKK